MSDEAKKLIAGLAIAAIFYVWTKRTAGQPLAGLALGGTDNNRWLSGALGYGGEAGQAAYDSPFSLAGGITYDLNQSDRYDLSGQGGGGGFFPQGWAL